MEAVTYFCTGTALFKKIALGGDCKDYKGFKIIKQVTSSVLLMNGVVITETVGLAGCERLADKIIKEGRFNDDPEVIAKDWAFKLNKGV